jgi:ribonuclease P/MRP protein subunit POP5
MVRFKNRYLLCEIGWEDKKFDPNLKNKDIYDAIRDSIAVNFGDFGLGQVLGSLSGKLYVVKYFNPATNLLIVRVQREEFRNLWCAITFITHIKGRRVRIKVTYTAGTIRTCQREIVKCIRNWIMDSQNMLEQFRKQDQGNEMIEDVNNIIP